MRLRYAISYLDEPGKASSIHIELKAGRFWAWRTVARGCVLTGSDYGHHHESVDSMAKRVEAKKESLLADYVNSDLHRESARRARAAVMIAKDPEGTK